MSFPICTDFGSVAVEYYKDINTSLKDDALKQQLKTRINSGKQVIGYNDLWGVFKETGKHLPGYPCDADLTKIPDIYSNKCWETSGAS